MLDAISLFSGAGGIDIGLERAGFQLRACVESSPIRGKTLLQNRPDWSVICRDIRELSGRDILNEAGLQAGEVDLVVGGPPCQPFSKSAFWVPGRLNSILEDPRASLLKEFIRIVAETEPRAFVMENVFGLAYKTGRLALGAFLETSKELGYSVQWKVLNAVNYGVPQKRQRLFVVGTRVQRSFSFPPPTHFPPTKLSEVAGVSPYVTAGDAIVDLDDGLVHEEERVGGKWGHLLDEIPPGENYLYLTAKRGYPDPQFEWRSRFWSFLLKLSPRLPSWTIQANPGPYVGPFHWQGRRLRISEIKRLQGFPDEWEFAGGPREQWSQVGDAVPPPLMSVIAESLVQQRAFAEDLLQAPLEVRGGRRTRQSTLARALPQT